MAAVAHALPVEVGESDKSLFGASSSGLSQEGCASRHVARATDALHEHHTVPVLAEGVFLLRGLFEPTARRSQVLRHALTVEVRLAEGSLRPAFTTFGSFAEPGPGGGALGCAYETAVATRCVGLVVVGKRATLALKLPGKCLTNRRVEGR